MPQRPSMVSAYRGGGRMGGGRSSRGGKGGRVDRSDRIVDRRLDPSPPGEGSRKVGGLEFYFDCEMHALQRRFVYRFVFLDCVPSTTT